MPGLTVTEKAHWKDRIGQRIDKRIEAIAAEDPALLERINKEARQRALQSLGLLAMQQELDEIENQLEALESRQCERKRAMLAHVMGIRVEETEVWPGCRFEKEIERAIDRRQKVHEDDLLAENEIGQRILVLREERENLLDTVWLATSPKQIKELWSHVADLLGDQQTRLQRDALAIDPVET